MTGLPSTVRQLGRVLLLPLAVGLVCATACNTMTPPPAASVLEGDWSTELEEAGMATVTFDSTGTVTEINAVNTDGVMVMLNITDSTTTLDGSDVTVVIGTSSGDVTLEGTLSDNENVIQGSLSRRIELGNNAQITIPEGDITLVRDGSDPCEGVTCEADETCVDGECVADEPMAAVYVGTQRCAQCHPGTATSFALTGHPFKLNKVEGGVAPTFPVTTLPGPPEGLDWTDTAYVIGGFRWKYRVIDLDGFVVLGPTAQYNFPSQTYGAYDNNDSHFAPPDDTPGPWDENIGRKPYACGPCHMTAYDADTTNRTGLPGLIGDWEFDGIQCEECHGPGGDHVMAPSTENIIGKPDTDTSCGKCHIRSSDGIAAGGGFVKHHEQYDEYSRTAHAGNALFAADGCMTCHNVHEPIFDAERLAAIQAAEAGDPTAVDGIAPPPGIIRQCTDCHPSTTVAHPQLSGGRDIECISCHMAFTGKSGETINDNMGDIRSHAWVITSDPDALMFTDADFNPVERDSGNTAFAALDEDGEPFITLDFACLRCHTDRDLAWAGENAPNIHP